MFLEKGQAGKTVRGMEKERLKKRIYIKLALLSLVWILTTLLIWALPRLAANIFIHSFSSAPVKSTGSSIFMAGAISFLFCVLLGFKMFFNEFGKKINSNLSTLRKKQYQAAKGAAAEETIQEILKDLPATENFFIIHDIKTPFGNIDHLVVSEKHGIFVIETKSHSGKVTTNGKEVLRNGKKFEKDFITILLKNTFWLKEKIKKDTGIDVFVTPILVFTNAFVTVKTPVKGVNVINKKYLNDFILKGKNRLKQNLIDYFLNWRMTEAPILEGKAEHM